MNKAAFDGIVREMSALSTRRRVFRLLGGAAALSAGLALATGDDTLAKNRGKGKTRAEGRDHSRQNVAAQRRGGGKKLTICFNNQTRTIKKSKLSNFPGATRGACPPGPKLEPQGVCPQLILSSGPNPSDKIIFDDDGSILNTTQGTFILIDNDGLATAHAARFLDANVGDLLRVRVTDWGGCRSLSPLWVHCAATGQSKQLFSGYNGGRCDYPKQADFLDFVLRVEL
jgi:hypothetical protein